MATNLLPQLLPEGVDDHELLHIISSHFNSGRSTPTDEVDYPAADHYALRIRHKNSRLVEIQRGPALTDVILQTLKDKVQSELVDSDGETIQRCIIFSSRPVKGFFRAEKLPLQICPAPINAPQPRQLIADHPFVLEFPIKKSRNGYISMSRRTRGMFERTWVLNALLRSSIRTIGPRSRQLWVIWSDVILPTRDQVKFVQESYTIDGFVGEATDFGCRDERQVPNVAENEYYSPTLRSSSDELEVPANLSALLEAFEGLAANDRVLFVRAARWVSLANEHWEVSASSYFMDLVAAIETLMPSTRSITKCPTCNRDVGPGPTQLFHDFVESYLPNSSWAVNKKKLYSIRSGLSHGGKMFHLDEAPWSSELSTTELQEMQAWMDLTQAVRLVLVNWLKSKAA